MLTFQELKDLGYDFKITGKRYEVTYLPRVKLAVDPGTIPKHDDTIYAFSAMFDEVVFKTLMGFSDSMTGRMPAKPPPVLNIPRHVGKSAALAAAYGASPRKFKKSDFWLPEPEIICSGTIQQAHERKRKGQGSYPVHVNMVEISNICLRAANTDYARRQLTR